MSEQPRVPAGPSPNPHGGEWASAKTSGVAGPTPVRGAWPASRFERPSRGPRVERDLSKIEWVQPKRAKHEAMIEVDVKKLDELWKKEGPGWRIDEKGSNAISTRLKDFDEWLNTTTEPVETPEVGFTDRGSISFTNGRHRFAYFRDKGVKTVKVSIPKREAKRLQELAGV